MKNYDNTFCRICGAEYHRCNCSSEESWRKVADTANHYKVFCVVRDYVNEIIDANKANSLLAKLDLTGRESFRENIKNVISDIEGKAVKIQPVNKNVQQNNHDKSNKNTKAKWK